MKHSIFFCNKRCPDQYYQWWYQVTHWPRQRMTINWENEAPKSYFTITHTCMQLLKRAVLQQKHVSNYRWYIIQQPFSLYRNLLLLFFSGQGWLLQFDLFWLSRQRKNTPIKTLVDKKWEGSTDHAVWIVRRKHVSKNVGQTKANVNAETRTWHFFYPQS